MTEGQKGSSERDPVRIGFLHPGEMGVALAKVVQRNGATAWWVSAGRSRSTAARAAGAGMQDAGTRAALCRECQIIISICPPRAAIDVARGVAACGFAGTYVDANAVSPGTAIQIADIVEQSGASYVDAAVIGPPPGGTVDTFIYLSGEAAPSVAGHLKAEALFIEMLGSSRSHASALQICHSAMQKGQFAMMLGTVAAAAHYGVQAQLEGLWAGSPSTRLLLDGLADSPRPATKGWRFAGEMLEVAETFAAAGLPPEFHRGVSEIFRRCPVPSLGQKAGSPDDLIRVLLDQGLHLD